jgi:hypothetical protein
MANTYTLIEAKTLTTDTTTVTFTAIPNTYTDLRLLLSVRNNDVDAFDGIYISLNGSTSNFTEKFLQGIGSGTPGSGSIPRYIGVGNGATSSSSIFSSFDVYFPNYASSNYKSFSSDAVTENNATLSFAELHAGLWSDTAAITSISVAFSSGPCITGSTFYLYGIKNS